MHRGMYVHHEERGRSTGKQEEVFEINGNLYKKTEHNLGGEQVVYSNQRNQVLLWASHWVSWAWWSMTLLTSQEICGDSSWSLFQSLLP